MNLPQDFPPPKWFFEMEIFHHQFWGVIPKWGELLDKFVFTVRDSNMGYFENLDIIQPLGLEVPIQSHQIGIIPGLDPN